MVFNTFGFFEFLAVVLVLFYSSPLPWRRYILLFASYFFYGSWNPKFIPLLLVLTAIDYTAGIWIPKVSSDAKRKAVLILSLAANLSFLGFFKYYNFLAGNLALAAGKPANPFYLNIVLPLGISFHTFQSISYVVDVYRGEQEPIGDLVDYALFICFFPQLVAGPIVRARNFFADLLHWSPPTSGDLSRAIFLIGLGLLKKMAFADQFARIANQYFGHVAANPGWLSAWSGVFAFAMQIYFDFAGYTDIAIGVAKLFGFHFPPNFRRPYLASSITDFWRRWHISLSTWLRDYLYIPLGGNRGGQTSTYRNLMLTMLLGGLWHGASWNFLIWGGYHGALLSVERASRGRQKVDSHWSWAYPFQAVLTFLLVLLGWVFFRAASLTESVEILRQMGSGRGHLLLEPWHAGLAAASLLVALVEEKLDWFDGLVEAPLLVRAAALGWMLFCLEILSVTDTAIPFIYFQF